MAAQTIAHVPALRAVPRGRRWVAGRRVVDGAVIGAAVGALRWLTVPAWASLTWCGIGRVIDELLRPQPVDARPDDRRSPPDYQRKARTKPWKLTLPIGRASSGAIQPTSWLL